MSTVPEESGSRFSTYSATDHQAPLWITTCITLTYAAIFFLVRLAVKWKYWGLDDGLLAFAHVFGLAQWVLTFAALNRDIGKLAVGSNASSLEEAAKLFFASRIVLLVCIGLSKCSVIVFLRQIFTRSNRSAWELCSGLLLVAGCWTIISVLAVSVRCSSVDALHLGTSAACPGELTRWRVVTGLDVFLEAALVIMPAYLFRSVRIRPGQKLAVLGAFVFRVGVPAIFIVYLESYMHFRRHGRVSLNAVTPLVWQQALCGYSLISATTPCLKNFLGRFRTDDLGNLRSFSTVGNPHNYALGTLKSRASDPPPPARLHGIDFSNLEPVAGSSSMPGSGQWLVHNGHQSAGSKDIMRHRNVEVEEAFDDTWFKAP